MRKVPSISGYVGISLLEPSYSGKDYLPSLTLLCGIKYSACKQRMNLTGVSTVMGFGHAPTF